ncbi:MAG: DUF434 domain-containing protein [Planctomycetes bacterium]|nr:DUF434 domain-containing protein [Planctomycetota bacterium]
MPDRRQHRGPHPADVVLFADDQLPRLREAVGHFSWLLSRGYAIDSSLKLVGDRFQLAERQRTAVLRASCSDEALTSRKRRRIEPAALSATDLAIDGFNVLTTIEAALSGGALLKCRDGTVRDLASMHGSYRKVEETRPALEHVGEVLERLRPRSCRWLLDRPVSNSGRLAKLIRETAADRGWNWDADTLDDVDGALIASPAIVASADSAVLDRAARWFNLAAESVTALAEDVWLVDLEASA